MKTLKTSKFNNRNSFTQQRIIRNDESSILNSFHSCSYNAQSPLNISKRSKFKKLPDCHRVVSGANKTSENIIQPIQLFHRMRKRETSIKGTDKRWKLSWLLLRYRKGAAWVNKRSNHVYPKLTWNDTWVHTHARSWMNDVFHGFINILLFLFFFVLYFFHSIRWPR